MGELEKQLIWKTAVKTVPEAPPVTSSSALMRRERVSLCDASRLINTKGSINTKEERTLDSAALRQRRGGGGNKVDLFYSNRATTANSIKFPTQLVIKMARGKKLPVSPLNSWVKYEAGNHNFTSIKVTWSSEPKSSKKEKSAAFFNPDRKDVCYLLFI